MHSRFFARSRNIFGTPLLQMKPNTIRRLCANNKYHFSVKNQMSQIEMYNSIVNQITMNLSRRGATTSDLISDLEEGEIKLSETDLTLGGLKDMLSARSRIISSIGMSEIRNLSTLNIDKTVIAKGMSHPVCEERSLSMRVN